VAAALALRLHTTLDLVHASDLPAHPPLGKRLHTEAERLRKSGAVIEEAVLGGSPCSEIVGRTRTASYHLIVVASNGKATARRWWLGSVSEGIAERAAIPTLVVRNPSVLLNWIRGRRPLEVFVAFNRTATSETALSWVRHLRTIGPCTATIGLVAWPPEERSRLGQHAPISPVDNSPEAEAVLDRDVRARARELLGSQSFDVRVEGNWGCPERRLAEMAREQGADLVVVGSHQYHGFERLWHRSVSRGLLHAVSANVLVVPLATRESGQTRAMQPVRRVIVATDFSDPSRQSIPHACSILGAGGVMRIVHVVHPDAVAGGRHAAAAIRRSFAAEHGRHVRQCHEALRAMEPEECTRMGIRTEVEVVEHPDPAHGIAQAAERFGADLVCMSTHGRTGISKVLLGSVAQEVMGLCKRPLLLVQQDEV